MQTEETLLPGCDCHIHIYDLDRYPIPQKDPVSPPQAPWSAYAKLQTALGLGRSVIVQPMGYGLDNRCTLDALASAQGSARAIVALEPDTARHELDRLNALGVVGVRFMLIPGGGGTMTWAKLPLIAEEIAALGWHINLQLDGRDLPQYAPLLMSLPCPVVIDHIGKFLEPVEPEDPAFNCLRKLLDTGRFHVKLSAAYETSRIGPPDYEDVGALARILAREHTERCLWASNWPHPTQVMRPDDEGLLHMLRDWAPTRSAYDRILRKNPHVLYQF